MLLLNILFVIDLTMHHTLKEEKIQDVINQTPHQGPTKFFTIKLLSSQSTASVAVDGTTVYAVEKKRAIHIVVISQSTGKVMATREFDTYTPGGDDALPDFIDSITNGRILCFTICDEGTFSMKSYTKDYIGGLGSKLISTLKWRDTWAFVTIKGDAAVGEDVGKSVVPTEWGSPVNLHVHLPILSAAETLCKWPYTPENERRATFCAQYEGYNDLCNCAHPLPLNFKPKPLRNNRVADVPVTIIASNRPAYLFRMLRKLLSIPGSNASMVTVFIDGFFQEPSDVASLFGVEGIQHEPLSQKNGRIAQHYKASLTTTFDKYPKAKYIIILEEDLEVAEDFFSYFSQTYHLMEMDSSIYCVSAWNDQGYEHSCQDPSLLYRIETMPGLGWLLSRRLYKEELEPKWPKPDQLWDWDMWMRTDFMRKGRECVIPDISRTYHFGASGLNMNPYFQQAYFKKHSINTQSEAVLRNVDRMVKDKYEEDVTAQLKRATVLDHSKDPCGKDFSFIPDTVDNVYVMFMSMEKHNDYNTWMQLAKCYHLWDLDARGFHNGLWRIWLKGNQILIVGVPFSKYSNFKPDNLLPIKLEKPR